MVKRIADQSEGVKLEEISARQSKAITVPKVSKSSSANALPPRIKCIGLIG
jgi:hypothetical protein